jgi:exodeoxyribonuclease VII small subunit
VANEKRSTDALAETPYERIVEELDQVVQQLEAGELSLEDSLRAYERGVKLAAAAEARLEQAEQRVEVLQGDRTVPLPPMETSGGGRRNVATDDEDAPF